MWWRARSGGGGGGRATLLRMVFTGFCLERGIDFINACLKQGIVTRPYVFVKLQNPHHKPNFCADAVRTQYKRTNSIPQSFASWNFMKMANAS